jgi:antitoxin (DNA-binding transcriptional repressor) of toxin-antitoxin stability system
MATHITATEAVRNFSDILNRVRYRGESFSIERAGDTIAQLSPVSSATSVPLTGAMLLKLGPLPKTDSDFADDLETVTRNQPVEVPKNPWES